MPGSKKAGNSNSGFKNFQLSSQKALANSGFKKPLETGKHMGLRTKTKNIVHPKVGTFKGGSSC
jgi:hypothetical protein